MFEGKQKLVALKRGDVVGISVEGDPEQRGVLFENIQTTLGPCWTAEEAWEWAQRICEAVNAEREDFRPTIPAPEPDPSSRPMTLGCGGDCPNCGFVPCEYHRKRGA